MSRTKLESKCTKTVFDRKLFYVESGFRCNDNDLDMFQYAWVCNCNA